MRQKHCFEVHRGGRGKDDPRTVRPAPRVIDPKGVNPKIEFPRAVIPYKAHWKYQGLMKPLAEAHDKAFENSQRYVMVFTTVQDQIFIMTRKESGTLRQDVENFKRNCPSHFLVMAIDTARNFEAQVPEQIGANLQSYISLKPTPIITLKELDRTPNANHRSGREIDTSDSIEGTPENLGVFRGHPDLNEKPNLRLV